MCSVIERSRRYGSPLADQFREQATALRGGQRRRIEEQAARAAPKIQLAVALLLVPSVLLMIAAGLLANIDRFLAGFLAGSAPEPDRLEVVAAVAAAPSSGRGVRSGGRGGGGPVQEGDRDQEADQREGRQAEAGEVEDDSEGRPATGRLSHRPATQIAGRRVSGAPRRLGGGRKTPLECGFRPYRRPG